MKSFKKFLNIVKETIEFDIKGTKIYSELTAKDLDDLLEKEKNLRCLICGKDIFSWNAQKKLHDDIEFSPFVKELAKNDECLRMIISRPVPEVTMVSCWSSNGVFDKRDPKEQILNCKNDCIKNFVQTVKVKFVDYKKQS